VSGTLSRWERVAIPLIVAAAALRFFALGETPRGFYVDEAAGAANIICVADEGRAEQGDRLPLFFVEFPGTGTFFTPTYVYSGALWTRVFGTSPGVLRGHAACYSLLAIAGVYFLARHFLGRSGGVLAALSAAVSPWAFQYARVAWDPSLMPAFLIWGVALFFRPTLRSACGSALLLAAAMYTYPTARLHVPLLVPVLLWLARAESRDRGEPMRPFARRLAIHFTLLAVVLAPLVILTLNGTLTARAQALSIFNRDWLMVTYQSDSAATVAAAFAHHFGSYLSPRFLFFSGDANLRHGTGMFGQLSWLDLFALVAALFTTVAVMRLPRRDEPRPQWRRGALLALWGIVTAFAVASLTWEGSPHASRSIGGWPFVSLLTASLLCHAARLSRMIAPAATAVAATFLVTFAAMYFGPYAKSSGPAFDSAVREEAEHAAHHATWERFESLRRTQAVPALRYYLMHYRQLSCSESARVLNRSRFAPLTAARLEE
jgi:hypothetical protein